MRLDEYSVTSECSYVVANYLAWRVVELMGPLTVERMRRCKFRFDRYRYSQFELPPLSRECYAHTARYMKFAVAKILYDQVQGQTMDRHRKIRIIAEEVKDAFAVWLDLATWMTDSNKKLAAFKLRDVKVNPGSPEWVMSESELDDYYSRVGGVTASSGSYIPVPRKLYESINFGALGSIIAYYLTLGFGAYGSMYNHKGVLDDWWSGTTRRQYGAETVCFKKQVEWFTNPFTGEEINGTVNQDELVADNAAVKEAFKTMCEKIRSRAFYYDLHPKKLVPNHHRTNLALMNFDRFAVAFDCPLGSPMNPELKCDVY
ncbi:hypothetical protein HPB50_015968 [Hyalomma asiaticum]|uniref:Uncharacterized protein n=1 Tax=Hyalomma asiaticum TaxID=266040 RepID=A0ACB7S3H9_HYAAI|nr:hypothetical protein HPB50_015968 [Hyalomma asiaticum]